MGPVWYIKALLMLRLRRRKADQPRSFTVQFVQCVQQILLLCTFLRLNIENTLQNCLDACNSEGFFGLTLEKQVDCRRQDIIRLTSLVRFL